MKINTPWNPFVNVSTAALLAIAFLSIGTAAQAQYGGDYGAYDPGNDYAIDTYSDPSPAPAPSGRSGKGILNGTPNFRTAYLQADYRWLSFSSDFLDDRNAFGGELSIAGSGNAYLKATGLFAPAPDDDLDDESYFFGSLGPGLALPIGSFVDVTFDGGLAYQKFDSMFSDLGDGIGFYLTPGIRVGLGNNIELTGALRYLNIDEQNGFAFQVGAHLYLNDNIVIIGSAAFSDEVNAFGAGLRINF